MLNNTPQAYRASKPPWLSFLFVLGCYLLSLPSQAQDKLMIAVGLAKPPYVFQADNAGFEIDLVRNVLAKMEKSVEFVYTSYGHAPKMLAVDEIDAVMTMSPKVFRDKSQLSDIYITYQNVAISLKEKQLNILTINDLANYSVASFQQADKILGPAFENAVNLSPIFLQVADQKRQPNLLLKGRVDVVVMDKNIFNYFARKLKIESLSSHFNYHNVFAKSHYRMAFKDKSLIALFNRAFLDYSSSKSYQRLLKQYQLEQYPLPSITFEESKI